MDKLTMGRYEMLNINKEEENKLINFLDFFQNDFAQSIGFKLTNLNLEWIGMLMFDKKTNKYCRLFIIFDLQFEGMKKKFVVCAGLLSKHVYIAPVENFEYLSIYFNYCCV